MTDKQILRNHEMGRLFFGPYRPPTFRRGDEMLCAVHGLCVVEGEHGPMGWPTPKPQGHPRPIVCGDLLRALEDETARAIALHWDIHPATVSAWKRALRLPRMSRAGSLIKAAQMRQKRAEHPELHVDPGAQTVAALKPRQRRRYGQQSAGDRVYTAEEDAYIRQHGPTPETAQQLGRTLRSVRSHANKTLRVTSREINGTEHVCLRCGHRWKSLLAHAPLKCSNPACRSLAWQRPRKP